MCQTRLFPSRWLIKTIRLGYTFQLAGFPPSFNGFLFTSGAGKDTPVLHAEIVVLLVKDTKEPVPPAKMKQSFYSPYFIVSKKVGGIRPVLDVQVLNLALHILSFKMLMQKHILTCIRQQD